MAFDAEALHATVSSYRDAPFDAAAAARVDAISDIDRHAFVDALLADPRARIVDMPEHARRWPYARLLARIDDDCEYVQACMESCVLPSGGPSPALAIYLIRSRFPDESADAMAYAREGRLDVFLELEGYEPTHVSTPALLVAYTCARRVATVAERALLVAHVTDEYADRLRIVADARGDVELVAALSPMAVRSDDDASASRSRSPSPQPRRSKRARREVERLNL